MIRDVYLRQLFVWDIKSLGKAEVFFISVASPVFSENPPKFHQKSQIYRTPLTGGLAKRSAKIKITPIPNSSLIPCFDMVWDFHLKRPDQPQLLHGGCFPIANILLLGPMPLNCGKGLAYFRHQISRNHWWMEDVRRLQFLAVPRLAKDQLLY